MPAVITDGTFRRESVAPRKLADKQIMMKRIRLSFRNLLGATMLVIICSCVACVLRSAARSVDVLDGGADDS